MFENEVFSVTALYFIASYTHWYIRWRKQLHFLLIFRAWKATRYLYPDDRKM